MLRVITRFFYKLFCQSYLDKKLINVIFLHDAQLLIEKGANVNYGDCNGDTALMHAAQYGCLEVAKLLIEKGANVNYGHRNGWTALMSAACSDYLEVAKLLIENGANVNYGNRNGWTALMSAANSGCLEVAKLLIEKGANVNYGDRDGWTALMCAANNSHTDVANALINAGAKFDNFNQDQLNDLVKACLGYKYYDQNATLSFQQDFANFIQEATSIYFNNKLTHKDKKLLQESEKSRDLAKILEIYRKYNVDSFSKAISLIYPVFKARAEVPNYNENAVERIKDAYEITLNAYRKEVAEYKNELRTKFSEYYQENVLQKSSASIPTDVQESLLELVLTNVISVKQDSLFNSCVNIIATSIKNTGKNIHDDITIKTLLDELELPTSVRSKIINSYLFSNLASLQQIVKYFDEEKQSSNQKGPESALNDAKASTSHVAQYQAA